MFVDALEADTQRSTLDVFDRQSSSTSEADADMEKVGQELQLYETLDESSADTVLKTANSDAQPMRDPLNTARLCKFISMLWFTTARDCRRESLKINMGPTHRPVTGSKPSLPIH